MPALTSDGRCLHNFAWYVTAMTCACMAITHMSCFILCCFENPCQNIAVHVVCGWPTSATAWRNFMQEGLCPIIENWPTSLAAGNSPLLAAMTALQCQTFWTNFFVAWRQAQMGKHTENVSLFFRGNLVPHTAPHPQILAKQQTLICVRTGFVHTCDCTCIQVPGLVLTGTWSLTALKLLACFESLPVWLLLHWLVLHGSGAG